ENLIQLADAARRLKARRAGEPGEPFVEEEPASGRVDIAAHGGEPGAAAFERDELEEARLKGYSGDPCPECGSFTLLRAGACLKCDTCGTSTGCS
ncbi:MAG: hypothetical protein MI723_01875, partial [Caulobacterales bacterium]|nr:hypothetical protein [Caulobacterales bacterium]